MYIFFLKDIPTAFSPLGGGLGACTRKKNQYKTELFIRSVKLYPITCNPARGGARIKTGRFYLEMNPH